MKKFNFQTETGNKTLDIKIIVMKKIQYIVSLFVLAILMACTNESKDINLDAVVAPTKIAALATITQNNSGKVTILPKGEGVSQYEVYYGDGTVAPAYVNPGSTTSHIYKEGVYQVKIVGTTVNGKRTEAIQEVTVSYLKPTDLKVNVAHVSGENFSMTVVAQANLEAYFQVYFGDVANEVPVNFMQDEVITHKYADVGNYKVRVVALSGGAATTEFTSTINISNPINLPIDFEVSTPPFVNFGGANSGVVSNPDIGSNNGSTKVGKLTKNVASEIWAGSSIELATPIDFSSKKVIKMKVWSPKSGIMVKIKLEKLIATDATSTEVNATSTVAGGWEELSFNFNGINNANNYQRVVVFFDFGVAGTGASYYYDDIQLVSGAEVMALPISFESSTLIYTFGDFGGAASLKIDNPKSGSINTSAKVGSLTKANGSQVWAGTSLELANPINFSTIKKLKMKVWSPKAGIKVLMKLEQLVASNSTSIEVSATSTVANGWEELSFDYPTIVNANNYQRVVVFFDFNVVGTGATYYFDDIKQSN